MKKVFWTLRLAVITLFLGSTVPPSAAVPPLGIRFAYDSYISGVYILSVGVNNYKAPLSAQRFAVADAVSIGDAFSERASAGQQRVAQGSKPALVRESSGAGRAKIEKIVLTDDEVTRESLAAAFTSIAQRIEANDIFVFNVAAVGHRVDGEFRLFTSRAKSLTDKSESIATSELQALVRKIRAKNKLIILDSCDSAAGYESLASAFIEEDADLRRAVDSNILFIGTDGITFESPELGHGILTKVILDGIQGDADLDQNGVVAASELEGFVYCGVMKYRKTYKMSPRTIRSGDDFNLAFSDEGRKKIVDAEGKAAETKKDADRKSTQPEQHRADIVGQPAIEDSTRARNGEDYALLFANDVYENPGWASLKNPKNDVRDVATELRDRYGFKEVMVKENLTTREIREVLTQYQGRAFEKPDDQLFIFFAGHGVTNKVSDIVSDSYYVGRNSPHPFTVEDSGHFFPLESILNMVAGFKIGHVMTVFDACYAGQIWKPAVTTITRTASTDKPRSESFVARRNIGKSAAVDESLILDSLPSDRLIFAKRTMNNFSRIVLTSGKRPVLDAFKKSDGTMSTNSPFADAFLKALREGGRNYGVLTGNEILTYVIGLPVQPMKGQMGGSDGDFVFVPAGRKTADD